jgi:hypothetical protein
MTGEEADKAIAEKVMGYTTKDGVAYFDANGQVIYPGADRIGGAFSPFNEIADAWQVVEAMYAKGWWPTITRAVEVQAWQCTFQSWWGLSITAIGSIGAAICLSALDAVDKQS